MAGGADSHSERESGCIEMPWGCSGDAVGCSGMPWDAVGAVRCIGVHQDASGSSEMQQRMRGDAVECRQDEVEMS